MPIPIHNFSAALFLSELGLQCHLVNRSAQRLERAAEHWIKLEQGVDDGEMAPPLDIVADCTVCLSAMAAIRRVLRPPQNASSQAKKRSEALLRLLGDPPLPNVTSVQVRNSWEHFDERLDKMLATRGKGAVSELYVSSMAPDSDTIVMRRFDPVGFAIYSANEAIALRPCIEEVKELSVLIDRAYVRLQSERVDV